MTQQTPPPVQCTGYICFPDGTVIGVISVEVDRRDMIVGSSIFASSLEGTPAYEYALKGLIGMHLKIVVVQDELKGYKDFLKGGDYPLRIIVK